MTEPKRLSGHALAALALTLLAWAALLGPSYFMGAHDAHHSLFFPIEFERGLRDGYWLPRWGADIAHGYGYPIFVFYAPLAFYGWAALNFTGLFGVVASTKALFALGFLLGAAGMMRLGTRLWGRAAGLLAAVAYTFVPYKLVNIYVRAALAEFTAMALLPWVALAVLRLIERPTARRAGAAALAYGALLWAHNITALLFSVVLGAMILFEWALRARREPGRALWRRAWPVAASILLGVLIGSAILLPSLAEQPYIRIEQWAMETYRYEDHFVYPAQLLSTAWGFGYSVPGPGDGMSFQLGLAALALAAIGVAHALRAPRAGRADDEARARVLFFAVALLVIVLLMLPLAEPLWALSPLSRLVQFPWRLLAVAAFPLALLAGSAARALVPPGEGHAPPYLLAILLLVGASLPYTQPLLTPPNPRDETQQTWRDYESKYPDMVGMVAQTGVQPQSSPMLADLDANRTPTRFEALDAGIVLTQQRERGGSAEATVVAGAPGRVRFLSYWYPGWRATLDGEPLPIEQEGGDLNLMVVTVPAGEHDLAFRFGDTPLRAAASYASLAGILIALALLGRRGGKRWNVGTLER